MRKVMCLSLGIIFLLPGVVYASQIYGFITSDGKVHVRTHIEIFCPEADPKPIAEGITGDDGSYRINVPKTGQCSLRLPAVQGISPTTPPSVRVFSYPDPVQYNLRLIRPSGSSSGYVLERR